MKITDEAVKAALEAFWDNEDEPIMTGMKRALEAAAPHMSQTPHDLVTATRPGFGG